MVVYLIIGGIVEIYEKNNFVKRPHFCKYDMHEIFFKYICSSLCQIEISKMIELFDNGL